MTPHLSPRRLAYYETCPVSQAAIDRQLRLGATSVEQAVQMHRRRLIEGAERELAGETRGAWNPTRCEPLSLTDGQRAASDPRTSSSIAVPPAAVACSTSRPAEGKTAGHPVSDRRAA